MKKVFLNLLRQNNTLTGKGTGANATDFRTASTETNGSVTVELTDGDSEGEPDYAGVPFEVTNIQSKGNSKWSGTSEGVNFDFEFRGGKLFYEATPAENFNELYPEPTLEGDLKNGSVTGKAGITRDELNDATAEGGDGKVWGEFEGSNKEQYGTLDLVNTKKHETDTDTFTAEDEAGNTYLLVAAEGANEAAVTVTANAGQPATQN